jgi:hypothetical protein
VIPVDGSSLEQFPLEWSQVIYHGIPVCLVVGPLKELHAVHAGSAAALSALTGSKNLDRDGGLPHPVV